MSEEDLLIDATARVLMIDHPANQVELPPAPPARESEAAALWRPADRLDGDVERIDLQPTDEERSTAAMMSVWVGVSALSTVIADSRPERQEEDDDEDEWPQREDEPKLR